MIQRVQTVYLISSIILNGAMFATALFKRAVEGPQDLIWIGLVGAAALSVVISLWAIFQYSNRTQQMKTIRIAQLFQIMLVGGSFGILFSLGGIGTYLWDEAIGVGLVTTAFGLQFLAVRGVRKDEELVKSMDRLR
jgi:hypothetical protein